MLYHLDPTLAPGVITIVIDGHPMYTAETYTIAEAFSQQLVHPQQPIQLPAETESTRCDRLHTLMDFLVAD